MQCSTVQDRLVDRIVSISGQGIKYTIIFSGPGNARFVNVYGWFDKTKISASFFSVALFVWLSAAFWLHSNLRSFRKPLEWSLKITSTIPFEQILLKIDCSHKNSSSSTSRHVRFFQTSFELITYKQAEKHVPLSSRNQPICGELHLHNLKGSSVLTPTCPRNLLN